MALTEDWSFNLFIYLSIYIVFLEPYWPEKKPHAISQQTFVSYVF